MAVEKPNGDVRICIDMRQPNQAIIDDFVLMLGGLHIEMAFFKVNPISAIFQRNKYNGYYKE